MAVAKDDAMPAFCADNEPICAMLMELSENEKAKGDEVRTDVYRRAALAVKAYKLSITSGKAARDSSFEQKIDELLKTGKFAEKGEDYWRRQLEDAEEDNVRGFKRSHPIEGERYQHE